MPARALKPIRISRRLLWRVVLLSLLLALLISSIQAWIYYREGVNSVRETVEQIKEIQAPGISQALWDFNRKQLVTQLEGLLNFPFIKHVSVNSEDMPYAEAGTKTEDGAAFWDIPLVHSTNTGSVTLGSLRILVDTAGIHHTVIKNILQNFIFMTMMVAFIAIILFLLFEGMVTHHLTTIGTYFRNSAQAQTGQHLFLKKQHMNDEIDILVDSYNNMSKERDKIHLEIIAAQENIKSSEDRYRRIVETSLEGIWVFDKEFTSTYVNRRMAGMLGYEPAETLGRKITDFIKPDQLPDHEQKVAARKLGQDQEYERCFSKRDGGELWTIVSPRGIFDEQGQFAGSFAMFTDITERKQAAEALLESEARIRRITDSARDAILMMAPDGRVSFWNPAAEHLLGYTRDEAIGQDLHLLIAPERYHDAYRAGFSKFRLTGQGNAIGKTLEMIARRKDGQEIAVSLSLSALNIQGGWHAVGILHDITARKRTEAQLIEMKDKAEAANKAKSEFLANMSHEIRTPLNGILGMLQLMEGTPLDDDQKECLLTAVKSSKRLARLLSDILDLSRIEAGRLAIQETAFVVQDLKNSLAELFSVAAKEKGLDLDFGIDERTSPMLIGDENRLQQILFNLVGNAIKFTNKGGVRVEMAPLPHADKSYARVLFTVSDTGIGIPDSLINDIFKPFTQAEMSRTRNFQGAGLGLSIVRKLVKMMGGELAVDTTEGEGTTMYLSLPFKLPHALQARAAQQTQTTCLPPEARLRVLFAEDEAVNLTAGKRMLEKSGYCVVTAIDGQAVLQRLAEQDFDLILMDVQMPVMDGVEAAKRIRASGAAYADIPMIAMTAYAMKGDREKFLAAGMDDYIAKPVEMKDLNAVIQRVLSKKNIP